MTNSPCLACGSLAAIGDRRKLCPLSAGPVWNAWENILEDLLEERGSDVCTAKNLLLGDDDSSRYVCRSCYKLLFAYHEKKRELMQNMEQVVETNSAERQQQSTTPGPTRKRCRDWGDRQQATKYPRLSTLYTGSPEVQVVITIA